MRKNLPKVILALLLGILILALAITVVIPEEDAPDGNRENLPDLSKLSEPTEAPEVPPSVDDPRQNVMVILLDDMRMDDLKYMPKTLEILGRNGITFPNMTASNPLCCPARAALMTGQYGHNNGVITNQGPYGGLSSLKEPSNILPLWLQAAGYNTAFFGKYMNGYGNTEREPIPAGWNWWDGTGIGTYSFTKTQFANNGDSQMLEDIYITTTLRERSNVLLEQFAGERDETGKPFFIFDSYVAPHNAIRPSDESKEKAGKGPIPEDKYLDWYLDERNPALDHPLFKSAIDGMPYMEIGEDKESKPISEIRFHSNDLFLSRVQSLASVDDAIENTVAKLEELGELDRTTIFFSSDNGYLLGERLYFGKQVPYTESNSVPLIISGGEFTGGQISQRWATHQDVVATILAIAEATPGRPQDGRTLIGANGEDPAPDELLLLENGNQSALTFDDGPYSYQGFLVGQDFLYAHWTNPEKIEELYDLRVDPLQTVNVASKKKYLPLVAALKELVKSSTNCSGPKECYLPNNLPKELIPEVDEAPVPELPLEDSGVLLSQE